MSRTLRVGLLLDSYDLPSWEYTLIDRLLDSPHASITVVVLNERKTTRKSLLRRIIGGRSHLLFSFFSRLDQKLFDVQPNAFEPKNAAGLLDAIPVLRVEPDSTKYVDRFKAEDILEVERHDLDLLLRFGFRILKGGILKSARYGIWSYHHGDNRVNRGGPAGFWEVFENWDVTGSTLQILSEELDAGRVLCRSVSQTDKRSVHRNRNSYYWKSVSFVPRMIRQLCTMGDERFFGRVDRNNRPDTVYTNRLFSVRDLTNWRMLRLLTAHALRYMRDKCVELIYFHQWTLFFQFGREAFPVAFWRFKALVPPRDRFFADPCVVRHRDKSYIFIEEFVYRLGKGHISVIEMDDKGQCEAPVQVLDESHHLSYPFVFEHEGSYFLIPETGSTGTVDLYKCTEFPFRWEFSTHLMEGVEAVDTTVFYHHDKWWLFTNMVENSGASDLDELFLFYSNELHTTAWTPHPLNPIVSDVTKARPAGRVFVHGGKIIRPSQNSSKRYGFGMKMNEIRVLSEQDYEEVEVQSIEPNWDQRLVATHTFSNDGNLTVIDGNVRRRRYF